MVLWADRVDAVAVARSSSASSGARLARLAGRLEGLAVEAQALAVAVQGLAGELAVVVGETGAPVAEVPQGVLWTVAEVAGLLGLSQAKVWQLVGYGSLRSVRVGRSRRVRPADLAAYVAALE